MTGPDDLLPARRKQAFRAFVRSNHPDVGGDPAVFVAGLESLRRNNSSDTGRRGEPSDDDPRFDAPIVVVAKPAGLRGLPARFAQWRPRRSRPARVR